MKDRCPKCNGELRKQDDMFFCSNCHDVYKETRDYQIIKVVTIIVSVLIDAFIIFPLIYYYIPGLLPELFLAVILWEINERLRQLFLYLLYRLFKLKRFEYWDHIEPDGDTYD